MRHVIALPVLAAALARPERHPPAALRPSGSARCRPACRRASRGTRDHDPAARSDAARRASTPVVTIHDGNGVSRDFTATETGEPGVYLAHVVFPESGSWNIAVDSGWWGEGGLTMGPVTIEGGPSGAEAPDSFPVVPVALCSASRRAAGGGDARREEALEADRAPAVGRRRPPTARWNAPFPAV